MNSTEQTALEYLKKCLIKFNEKAISASEIQKRKFNFEVDLTNNKEKIKFLVYFGKNGIKTILQGNKELKIYSEIHKLLFSGTLFEDSNDSIDEFIEPKEYIGTDESGKGDYFGPLVIAGVFVNGTTSDLLKSINVKDSKELSDNSIERISSEIKKIIKNNYEIILITPKKYNELYSKVKNVNKILGWGHAKVLENLLLRCDAKEAISDKFGDDKLITNSLQERGEKILLHQFTKAERYTAVAAASILARQKFVEWFNIQKNILNFSLPKGASNLVVDAAIHIKNKFGEEKLNDVAKLHFKTTLKIIST